MSSSGMLQEFRFRCLHVARGITVPYRVLMITSRCWRAPTPTPAQPTLQFDTHFYGSHLRKQQGWHGIALQHRYIEKHFELETQEEHTKENKKE